MAILGIDLGTSSVKVIVLDTQGQTLSVSKADYEVMSLLPGWAESNPSEWWHATISAVQGAVAQAPHASITAVGLSGQMHGVVPTDEQGQPTRAALLWADTRAEAELTHSYLVWPAHSCAGWWITKRPPTKGPAGRCNQRTGCGCA